MEAVSGAKGGAAEELERLAADYFHGHLDAQPVFASTLGFAGYESRVADPSREGDARWIARLRAFAVRGEGIDPSGLDRSRALTRAILLERLRLEADSLEAATGEVSVSGSIGGDLSMTLSMVGHASLPDDATAEAFVRRLEALGGYFDGLGLRYRQAREDGRFPVASGVRSAVRQLDGYLAGDVATDPLLRPVLSAATLHDGWQAKAAGALREHVRPALDRLRSVWLNELLPVARDDEHPGLCHVPGGEQAYGAEMRLYTTTVYSAEEIHRLGLARVAELREEIAELGEAVFGTGRCEAVLQRAHAGGGRVFDSPDEVLDCIRAAYGRAREALPGWFKDRRLPDCEIRALDPHQAGGGAAAYYLWPSADGSRPGVLWVNTRQAVGRPAGGIEALAFHEGVPGHHLQVSVAAGGDDLPDFRRHRRLAAHSEGWGLYAERLADAMGLYSSPEARLGMCTEALMRAARLVVDTGVHALGWSRNRALEYLRANSDRSPEAVENEIDRYIAVPGQALSYMVGQVRLEQLRDEARAALGSAFDIAEFHDLVLADGSMPLDVLAASVGAWVKDGARVP
ncbi:DUF885 domain-containing protein [Streptacidiphilus neutrinimicus]|uniref:DUF885 domain-containing protein n=1 Tax=Streptacidiphilus neutrinimicus TaxID=105420 RepID=UPI000A509A58|nr:DUF885 domain-containing protein [Streptacidiphilus neutrinimicus]